MSQNRQPVLLRFPIRGLDRRGSYSAQPPGTTPYCLNVRPFETSEGRERGGSRPGLSKAYYTAIGSGNPVRMMNSVTYVESSVKQTWSDQFLNGALDSIWTAAQWLSDGLPAYFTSTVPLRVGSYCTHIAGTGDKNDTGAVRDALAGLDSTQAYQIDMYIIPCFGSFCGTWSIYGRMDNTTPVALNDGLTMTGDDGSYSGTLKVYVAGVLEHTYTFTAGTMSQNDSGWFSMVLDGDNVKCYWRGTLLIDQTLDPADHAILSGTRLGFGSKTSRTTLPVPYFGWDPRCYITQFRVQYKASTETAPIKDRLVSSSNGVVYLEDTLGENTAVTTSLTLASDRLLMSAERAQKLYIADWSEWVAHAADGVANATSLDSATYSNWTTLGLNIYDYVVWLSDVSGAAVADTYTIATIAAGNLTLGATTSGVNATVTFYAGRGPKVYDPVAGTLALWTATAGKGQVPTGCPLVCRYRDRLVLAAPDYAPHAWFMSRQGDPLDWDYGADSDDYARAVYGQNSDAGVIGQPLKALIPCGDDMLVFACESSLWVLKGDPCAGGVIDAVSRTIGAIDKAAWCEGRSGEIYFLSRDGMYVMLPGANDEPKSLSRERLPNDLVNIDTSVYDVQLAYDVYARGVHICLTPKTSNTTTHWWFDIQSASFWPCQYENTVGPTAVYSYTLPSSGKQVVLWGGRDGYIRTHDDSNETDDNTAINAYVALSPIPLGQENYREGIIHEIIANCVEDSGEIDWSLYVGGTHQFDFGTDTPFATGTWNPGVNYTDRPRARGQAAALLLEEGQNRRWGIETITATIAPVGKQRLS